jgi:hypothetical protein
LALTGVNVPVMVAEGVVVTVAVPDGVAVVFGVEVTVLVAAAVGVFVPVEVGVLFAAAIGVLVAVTVVVPFAAAIGVFVAGTVGVLDTGRAGVTDVARREVAVAFGVAFGVDVGADRPLAGVRSTGVVVGSGRIDARRSGAAGGLVAVGFGWASAVWVGSVAIRVARSTNRSAERATRIARFITPRVAGVSSFILPHPQLSSSKAQFALFGKRRKPPRFQFNACN